MLMDTRGRDADESPGLGSPVQAERKLAVFVQLVAAVTGIVVLVAVILSFAPVAIGGFVPGRRHAIHEEIADRTYFVGFEPGPYHSGSAGLPHVVPAT